MPVQLPIAQMLRCIVGAFGEMEQVEIHLHRRDAAEAFVICLARKDTDVVGPDELEVGPLWAKADCEAFGNLPWISVYVDGCEPEPRELVNCPGCSKSGKRVMDIKGEETIVEAARDLDPGPAEVRGD